MDTTQFKYLVLCAHGEIRTHTNWGLKPGPLPIGLREHYRLTKPDTTK